VDLLDKLRKHRDRQQANAVVGDRPESGESFLARLKATPKKKGSDRTETLRAISLPRRTLEWGTDLTQELRTPSGTMRLRQIQSQALQELRDCRGLLAPIGVGHGKTLVALLAGTVMNTQLTIILAPASTVGQLWQQHAVMAKHWRLPELRIYSYAQLSQPKNTDLLPRLIKDLDPSRVLIVADEAHRIKRKEAARTKRIIRFFQENPEVRFVALSGTMTSKSLKDFSHLADLALREKAPLPRDRYHLEAWCECIDVDGRPDQNHWRLTYPLWNYYEKVTDGVRPEPGSYTYRERRQIIRDAFRDRLLNAEGVVATGDTSVQCSLNLYTLQPRLPEIVDNALSVLSERDEDPAGEPIEDDAAMWRVARHISQGFYYIWDWSGEPDTVWLQARRRWHRYIRAELNNNAVEGYDSPLLVFNRIKREYESGQPRFGIHSAYADWVSQKHKKAPPTLAIWLDDYLIKEAVEWAEKQTEPVILWYDTKAVGSALSKYMPVYGAGAEMPRVAETCGMSINAHGVGKNLQAWSNQLVISPPSSGKTWEQLLGRLHRLGQKADEVHCSVFVHTESFIDAMNKADRDARYIQGTSGNRQKLLYATREV